MRLKSSFLSSLKQSKFTQIKCYIYLLIWIVISLALYWFLITNFVSTPTSTSSQDGLFIKRPPIIFDDRDYDHDKSSTKGRDTSASAGDVIKSRTLSYRVSPHNEQYIEASNNEPRLLFTTLERICNPPDRIQPGDENLDTPEYQLYAVIVLIRHGDRGPLTHVGQHNITNINCQSSDPSSDVKNLLKFTESISKQPGYLQFIGPFHTFPKVPTSPRCHLGQLTQLGSAQLVQLGRLIRKTYQATLFHDLSLKASAGDNAGKAFKIIAYSTRYRRTLQSLVSFLYGLLGPKYVVPNVTIRESQSITFCFNDCSCRLVERLKKISTRSYQSIPEDKLEMTGLVKKMNSILGITRSKRTGVALLDLLLVYSCHNTSFPCLPTPAFPHAQASGEAERESPPPVDSNCITAKDVTSLINLIQREAVSLQPLASNYHFSLLSAYGLLKEITNLALKMSTTTSASAAGNDNQRQQQQSRIAIFSGHDTTLQSILGALGVFSSHPDLRLPPYASRFMFEFYRKTRNISPEDSVRKYHFRALYNGISVTHLISFCRPNFGRFDPGASAREFFCPLENLVRFVHDQYFESFGNTTTNFRDACQYKP